MKKKLVVGLGNPGAKYKNTRHNAGFMVLDLLAADLGITLGREKRGSVYGEGKAGDCHWYLVKPQVFMNNSGEPVREWARKEGLDTARDLLVVCDDMNLEPGRLRLKPSGSSGAHNGLASVIECLGGPDFARLRVGVGRPALASQWADYVLEKFSADERKTLEPVLAKAAEGSRLWLEEKPFEKIMSLMNGNAHAEP